MTFSGKNDHDRLPGDENVAATTPFTFGLDSVASLFGLNGEDDRPDPMLGTVVGGTRLVRLIGEGGMGRVYEGLQDQPRRPVAVKLMRPGMASRELYRRFLQEAEILGKLRHPGIAQIYAAGVCPTAETQVPFFVMEYIPNALPITEYAAKHSLTISERVQLFRLVCEAVAHGHDHGVVHRDLKPGNILVDPEMRPKVIDFGVARIEDASLPPITALTEAGRVIGTLQYMSPEQLMPATTEVDRRADIYSLGVVLYELLTARLPYDISRRVIYDAVRIVMEQVPQSPSEANPLVPPTVSDIVAKCLKKEPARRYGSAHELAESLGRSLAGGEACPTAANYRPSFFAFRSGILRYAAIAAVLITLFTVGSSLRDQRRLRRLSETPIGDLSTQSRTTPLLPHHQGDPDLPASPVMPNQPIPAREETSLTREIATNMVAYGRPIEMPSLKELDHDVASILARAPGKLALNGIHTISGDVARELARQRGTLCLDGVTTLDHECAAALAQHDGWLNLGGLRDISQQALECLLAHRGGLTIGLPGVLTEERAKAVATHVGQLYLLGVESVDARSAEIIALHNGPVALDVVRLSADAEATLERAPHVYRYYNH